MIATKPKIVNAFSITNTGKAQLQHFMDAYFDTLRGPDGPAKNQAKAVLQKLLKEEILPKQITDPGLPEALPAIFSNQSEYALLIRNFPERPGFEHKEKLDKEKPDKLAEMRKAEESYSYHFGQALYEMHGAESLAIELRDRASHLPAEEKIHRQDVVGPFIHRDALKDQHKQRHQFGEFIIFSCPYNGEHAVTEVINLRRAIESLPNEIRERVWVETKDRIADGYEITTTNLNDVLRDLRYGPQSPSFLEKITLPSPPIQEGRAFLKAVEEYGKPVDIQPGDILIVNEHYLFHRAHAGDPEAIANISPQHKVSRTLLHHAGARI